MASKIGLRQIQALGPNQIVYDGSVVGFAARRQQSEAVVYVLRYRTTEGRQRTFTIGRHGSPWTPDTARSEAIRLLGEIVKGGDPMAGKQAARKVVTVADLVDDYWSAVTTGRLLIRGGKAKKISTLISDRGRLEKHIKPLLGNKPVATISRREIE